MLHMTSKYTKVGFLLSLLLEHGHITLQDLYCLNEQYIMHGASGIGGLVL